MQGGVSTASFDNTAQEVSAIVDIYNREEPSTALEIVESLPSFDVVLSEALAVIANNTAQRLGVTDDLAAYLNTENTVLSDYSMIVNVTLLHTLGRTGNQLLASAVESGDMSAALSDALALDIVAGNTLGDSVAVPVMDAPAPAMVVVPVEATPIRPGNAAVSASASSVFMALAGIVCLSAFML